MSRIHDDRKDMYREGVLTSASNIRSIHTISQNMEKEKIEKSSFVPHSYGVNESGFRAIDLLKQRPPPQGRSIVPASLGSTQLHAMPPLLPNYIAGSGLLTNVPMNHSLVRGSLPSGQHAFQTHIPGIAPPRGNVTMSQRSLPSLKPTNLSNQIQLPLNQIPGLPTILPPSITSSRTGSPIVSSHNLQNDGRVDSRTGMLSDHHGIRGNMQAPSQHGTQATIQVIASGTAVQQPHIPASFLSKGMNLNATSNMLKIGVTSHSNASPGAGISGSAFKLGIGKAYPGSSAGVIIPGTTSVSKSDIPDGRHSVGPPAYNRFPTACLPNNHHNVQSHAVSTPITTIQTSTMVSEPRPHTVGVPYHPISGAYVFHDMGHSIGLHSFPHLIRPPSTSAVGSLPMFPVYSQRGVPTVPMVSVSSKNNPQISEPHDSSRTDGLTIHGGTSFNIQNLYPNLQPSSFSSTFSSATNTIESSVRPSILRKRPTETPTIFPVQPSEKERISSPIKQDNILNMIIPSRILSPTHPSEKIAENSKPTNHSILSITSDLKNNNSTLESPTTCVNSNLSKVTAPPILITNSLTNNLANSNIAEASPKKKPRKQLIITTEDKYGTTTPINSCATDEDEEFLKANETMKDITPPKLTPSQPAVTTTSHLKNLFPSDAETSLTHNLLQEHKDLQLNGLITVTTESRITEPVKYYIFRRRPQVSIISEYKINSKAAHNHFYRYSDIKVKDEKKTLVYDKLLTKSSVESSTGWRLHHLSSQFDDLVQVEGELCEDILLYKDAIPSPSDTTGNFETNSIISSEDSQLRLLHELLQGNIQRCRHSIEQLEEAKQTMFNLLEHRPKYIEIRKQRKEKPKIKKKGVS